MEVDDFKLRIHVISPAMPFSSQTQFHKFCQQTAKGKDRDPSASVLNAPRTIDIALTCSVLAPTRHVPQKPARSLHIPPFSSPHQKVNRTSHDRCSAALRTSAMCCHVIFLAGFTGSWRASRTPLIGSFLLSSWVLFIKGDGRGMSIREGTAERITIRVYHLDEAVAVDT